MSENSIAFMHYEQQMKHAMSLSDAKKVTGVLKKMQADAEKFDADLANDLIMPLANWRGIQNDQAQGLIGSEDFRVQRARFFNNANYWTERFYDALEYYNKWEANRAETIVTVVDKAGNNIEKEKIIDPEHPFFTVDFLQNLMSKSNPICKVNLRGGGSGTGWLLKGGYLITNHHVLRDREAAQGATYKFNFIVDNINADVRSTEYRQHHESVFLTSPVNELDFSIIKLADKDVTNQVSLTDWNFLELEQKPAYVEDKKVFIVQHPRGGVKQIVLTGNVITGVDETRLKYSANTEAGSSGSPVMNEHLKVIALHHAFDRQTDNNQGSRVDKIIADLQTRGEIGTEVLEQIL